MLCDAETFLEIDDAKIVAKALKVDDPSWCNTKFSDNKLIIQIKTDRVESLISAFEDYFRNIKAAVDTLNALNNK